VRSLPVKDGISHIEKLSIAPTLKTGPQKQTYSSFQIPLQKGKQGRID